MVVRKKRGIKNSKIDGMIARNRYVGESSGENCPCKKRGKLAKTRVVLENQLFKLVSGRRVSRNERNKLKVAPRGRRRSPNIRSSQPTSIPKIRPIELRQSVPAFQTSNLGQWRATCSFPCNFDFQRPSQFCPSPFSPFPPPIHNIPSFLPFSLS